MGRRVILVFLVALVTINIHAQSNEFKKQRAQLALFNVGFNGLIGGVGGWINKEDNKTFLQAFSKGFYQGAIGGTISHIGLSLTHQIYKQRNISYAWPARIVNAFGTSIVQNSAEGRRMLARLHFNLYVSRIDFYPYEKRVTARLFSSSIYGIIVAGKNNELNLSKSLQTGVIYFETNKSFVSTNLGDATATAQVSSIAMASIPSEDRYYDTFSHEVAHILQYDRKVGGNVLLLKIDKKLKQKYKPYKVLSNYIYFDLNGPIFYAAYRIEGLKHRCNFFEQEAVNYSARLRYKCN